MAYPGFSELSFGYCFLRELESRHTHGGRFPKAPDFISQHDEATKGYDVEVALDGAVPLFIQLKRSDVMIGDYAREFGSGWFPSRPAFRMNLHRRNKYAQHGALQDLESDGEQVIYATSQIEEHDELSGHCLGGTVISAATAMFSPNEIQLPDLTATHHVSFYADKPWAVVFSEKGGHFERRFPSAEQWLSQLFNKPRDREGNQSAMRRAAQRIRARFGPHVIIGDSVARHSDGNPVIEAAILSYFLLDAQLTFVKPPKKSG